MRKPAACSAHKAGWGSWNIARGCCTRMLEQTDKRLWMLCTVQRDQYRHDARKYEANRHNQKILSTPHKAYNEDMPGITKYEAWCLLCCLGRAVQARYTHRCCLSGGNCRQHGARHPGCAHPAGAVPRQMEYTSGCSSKAAAF